MFQPFVESLNPLVLITQDETVHRISSIVRIPGSVEVAYQGFTPQITVNLLPIVDYAMGLRS